MTFIVRRNRVFYLLFSVILYAIAVNQTANSSVKNYEWFANKHNMIESLECTIHISFSEDSKDVYPGLQDSIYLEKDIAVDYKIFNEQVEIVVWRDEKIENKIIYSNGYYYINDEKWASMAISHGEIDKENLDLQMLPSYIATIFLFPLMPNIDDFYVLYGFSPNETANNSYHFSINSPKITISGRPVDTSHIDTTSTDEILFFDEYDRIIKRKYKYPEVIANGAHEDSLLIYANKEWNNYVRKNGIFVPTCFRTLDLSSNKLLIEARIEDSEGIRVNQPLSTPINLPTDIERVIEYKSTYKPVPEWKKVINLLYNSVFRNN